MENKVIKQASFITLITFQKIAQNPFNTMEQRMYDVPLCTMYNRWDGKIGFIGGLVDQGEDLLTAAIREFEEESGVRIKHLKHRAIKLYEETLNTTKSTLYYIMLEVKEFHDIVSKMTLSQSFNSEGSPMIVHLVDHKRKDNTLGFTQFLNHNFAPMAKNGLLSVKELVDNYYHDTQVFIGSDLVIPENKNKINEIAEKYQINVIDVDNTKYRNQSLKLYWEEGFNIANVIHTDGVEKHIYLNHTDKNNIHIDTDNDIQDSPCITSNLSRFIWKLKIMK